MRGSEANGHPNPELHGVSRPPGARTVRDDVHAFIAKHLPARLRERSHHVGRIAHAPAPGHANLNARAPARA